ncbi:MAG: cysteine--tRNA ligase [Candidatus Firestonebacteria bacterium]
MLKIYNTLTSKKEEFIPIDDKQVKIYTCGPTVYWYQHIGNLRTYIFSDILKKVLGVAGFKIKHVINITDVGHLTSDADEGEDKIEEAAKKENKKVEEITDYYWNAFKEDFKRLNIAEPTIWCKATDHIKEQIELVIRLQEKGFTYKTTDGIYFDTSKFKKYGELAKSNIEGLMAGKRVDLKEKKNPTDFALWKLSVPSGVRQQEWESPWGVGFPGWHLECSAMSMKYLGEHFDIHTGGIDHIPIHHTNEMAQSEAATGKKFVNYWLHGGFLTFKGEKVSKSKGGLYTISELIDMNFSPLGYRYFVLNAHYRTQLNFSLVGLKNAQNSYNRLKSIIKDLEDDKKINNEYLTEFKKAIDDDLDMPRSLSILWGMIRDKKAKGKVNTLKEMDKVFNLSLFEKEEIKISDEIRHLIDERNKARLEKDWEKADEIRNKLEKEGMILEDTSKGTIIRKFL